MCRGSTSRLNKILLCKTAERVTNNYFEAQRSSFEAIDDWLKRDRSVFIS